MAFALALAGALAAAAIAWSAGDAHGGAVTLMILLPVGLLTVAAAQVLVVRRGRLGGLRRQFGLLGLLAAAQAVLAVALFVGVMYVSGHDALLTVLVVLYAGGLAAWSARLLGRRALADVEAIRTTVAAVGDGRRDVRTQLAGPDELGRLGSGVDAMVARLAGEERARATLMAGLSHDLRTPLTSLGLIADAIGDGLLDEGEVREYAGRITTHVQALSGLIDGLFELSRLQAGGEELLTEPVALDALARQAVEALRPAADAGAVTLVTQTEPGAAPAQADPGRVLRVLFNLVQNAIRHTPAGGTVTVLVRPAATGTEVQVADTGPGFAPEERERAFEAFFRGDPSRTDPGAGLGLAISRAIVEAHAGTIAVGDVPVGATVAFTLPLAVRGRVREEDWTVVQGVEKAQVPDI